MVRKYDAVLGGNNPPPVDGLVLGGIKGLKIGLEKETDIPRKILMLHRAFFYGEAGLDLVLDIFKNESGKIKYSAYKLLKRRKEDKVKKAIESYHPLSKLHYKFSLENYDIPGINTFTITPDGKKIVTGSWDGIIVIWDLQTGKLQRKMATNEFDRHGYHLYNLHITPNGKQFYTIIWTPKSRYVARIFCWDLETEKQPKTLTVASGKDFPILRSLSGNKILYQSEDNNLEVLNLETEEIELSIPNSGDNISKLIFSCDEKHLMMLDRLTILAWDLSTGRKHRCKLKKSYSWHLDRVRIAKNSKTLISTYQNDIHIGNLCGQRIQIKDILKGHTDWIEAIKITPDGRYMISYGEDRTIRIWNLHTKETIRVIENTHSYKIDRLAITPDSETIVFAKNCYSQIEIWGI